MNLFWTPNTYISYDSIVNYLSEKITQKQVDSFYFTSEEVLDLVLKNSYLFKTTGDEENIHTAIIHKCTTLYFEIDKNNNRIALLSFFDTRQNPNKRNLLK